MVSGEWRVEVVCCDMRGVGAGDAERQRGDGEPIAFAQSFMRDLGVAEMVSSSPPQSASR